MIRAWTITLAVSAKPLSFRFVPLVTLIGLWSGTGILVVLVSLCRQRRNQRGTTMAIHAQEKDITIPAPYLLIAQPCGRLCIGDAPPLRETLRSNAA
jgi:hypothetical protein